MNRRQKYHLLRWCEETFAGATIGFLFLVFLIDAMVGCCVPLIAAIVAGAISNIISFECGAAARRMRKKKR